MRDLVVPVADLLLGACCAGCGGPALLLCRRCGEAIRPEPDVVRLGPAARALRGPPPVVTVAAGVNLDVLRRVVVAWKEEGVTRLTGLLEHHLAAAIVPHVRDGQALVLVPVPTSRRSRRRRGTDLVGELARGAARRLRAVGVEVDVLPALTYARTTLDQAGLGVAERRANLAGAFRMVPGKSPGRQDVIVVDDIVTTGATVAEAVRVLAAAGFGPVGVSVVAATPRVPETSG